MHRTSLRCPPSQRDSASTRTPAAMLITSFPPISIVDAHAGGDADHEFSTNFPGYAFDARFQVRRLHGENQTLRFARASVGRGARVHRMVGGKPLTRRGQDLNDADRAAGVSLGDQAADQRARHIAAAEKGDFHAGLSSRLRAPKIAVPMRTMVAPAAMASSMSSDMPIDRVSKPNRAASSSYKRRIFAKSPAAPGAGIAMRPRRRRRGRRAIAAASSVTSFTATPLLLASPEMFTSIRTLSGGS